MTPLELAGLTIFFLLLMAGVLATIFGLPGTLLILASVLVYAVISGFEKIGIRTILVLCLLAILAEGIEFLLGVTGAVHFGASKAGVWASIIGGLAGAVLLTPLFLGLGAVAGAFLGGFAGTLSVELFRRQKLKPAFRAAMGTFVGRVAGTLVKGVLSIAMVVITVSKIYS